jgi:hypothetical protein
VTRDDDDDDDDDGDDYDDSQTLIVQYGPLASLIEVS